MFSHQVVSLLLSADRQLMENCDVKMCVHSRDLVKDRHAFLVICGREFLSINRPITLCRSDYCMLIF